MSELHRCDKTRRTEQEEFTVPFRDVRPDGVFCSLPGTRKWLLCFYFGRGGGGCGGGGSAADPSSSGRLLPKDRVSDESVWTHSKNSWKTRPDYVLLVSV